MAAAQISSLTVQHLSEQQVEELGYDPAQVSIYSHPDVVSVDSSMAWLGIYEQVSGSLVYVGVDADPGVDVPGCQL